MFQIPCTTLERWHSIPRPASSARSRGRAGGVERASNILNLRQTVVNRSCSNFGQLPLPSLQDNSSQLILRLPVEHQAITRTPLKKQSYMGGLPTELVDIILQYVAALSLPNRSFIEPQTLFPNNATSFCTRWLSILKSYPLWWDDVVIDVANDPAPFLDTLTLLNTVSGYPTSVNVFSSTKGSPGTCEMTPPASNAKIIGR